MLKAQIIYQAKDSSEIPLMDSQNIATVQALAQCILAEYRLVAESVADPVLVALIQSKVQTVAAILAALDD